MPTRLSVRWLVLIGIAILTLVIAAMISAILLEGEAQSEDTGDTSVGGLWTGDVAETPGRTRVYATDGPAEAGTVRELAEPGDGMLLAHGEYAIWHDSGSDWVNGKIRVFQSDSGDELWSRPMKGTGTYPAVYQDGLYIVTPTDVKRLDLATGEETASFPHGFEADWIGNDFDHGSASDLTISDGRIFILFNSGSMASSDHRSLVVLDHDAGEELWSKVLPHGFRFPVLLVSNEVVVASEDPFLGNGMTQAWAIEDGEQLWEATVDEWIEGAVVSVAGQNAMYIATFDDWDRTEGLGVMDVSTGDDRWFLDVATLEDWGCYDRAYASNFALSDSTLYLFCGELIAIDLESGDLKSTTSPESMGDGDEVIVFGGDRAYLCNEGGSPVEAIDLATGGMSWSVPDDGSCRTIAVSDGALYWLDTDGVMLAMGE